MHVEADGRTIMWMIEELLVGDNLLKLTVDFNIPHNIDDDDDYVLQWT